MYSLPASQLRRPPGALVAFGGRPQPMPCPVLSVKEVKARTKARSIGNVHSSVAKMKLREGRRGVEQHLVEDRLPFQGSSASCRCVPWLKMLGLRTGMQGRFPTSDTSSALLSSLQYLRGHGRLILLGTEPMRVSEAPRVARLSLPSPCKAVCSAFPTAPRTVPVVPAAAVLDSVNPS